MNTTRLLALLILAATIFDIPSSPAQETPLWELVLKDQLHKQKQCELNYMTNLKTDDLGANVSIQGRAHCADGRAFDVRSLRGGERFDIRECDISVC